MRWTSLVLIVIGLAGCQRSATGPLAIGGSEAEDIVRLADEVSVSLLVSSSEYRPTIGDYEIEFGPLTPSPAVRDQLREIFLKLRSPSTPPKACIPDFRVQIHFQKGDSEVDVLLCLECRIMAIYHNFKAFTCDDFDGVAPQLTALAQEMFPADPDIQAIKIRH